MSRHRMVCGAALLVALATTAPALASGGSATEQGYPSATTPPSAPTVASSSTPTAAPAAAPTARSAVAGSQASTPAPTIVGGVAGAQKTLSHPAGAVSPALRAVRPAAGGVLPFTGLQLALFALAAVVLIGGGLALRAARR
jgi:hypothetical protein